MLINTPNTYRSYRVSKVQDAQQYKDIDSTLLMQVNLRMSQYLTTVERRSLNIISILVMVGGTLFAGQLIFDAWLGPIARFSYTMKTTAAVFDSKDTPLDLSFGDQIKLYFHSISCSCCADKKYKVAYDTGRDYILQKTDITYIIRNSRVQQILVDRTVGVQAQQILKDAEKQILDLGITVDKKGQVLAVVENEYQLAQYTNEDINMK